jgi:hypothetical protein
MEGKAMKKKIILFSSFLLIAMFLTGCATNVTAEEIKNLKEIASEIKRTGAEGYQLPDGYEVEYTDSTKTGRITIVTEPQCGMGEEIKATFDITKEEPELQEIKQPIDELVRKLIFGELAIIIIVILIILVELMTNDEKRQRMYELLSKM